MNPSGQPFPGQYGGGQMPPPPSGASAELNVPSILLMAFGAISVLYGLFSLAMSFVNAGQTQDALRPLLDNPDLPPALKNMATAMAGPGAKMINLLSMALAGFMAFGGFQMRNLKSYGVCVASCVVAMLPCGSCCCLITMPIGIWSLIILMKPEIKSAFS